MTENIQVFIEYKVKADKIKEYEKTMEGVITYLQSQEISDYQWFVATDQPNLYVEMFKVRTEANYVSVKKQRQAAEHPIARFVNGTIHCWAFKEKAIQ